MLSEIFKDGLTDSLPDRGDYIGPLLINRFQDQNYYIELTCSWIGGGTFPVMGVVMYPGSTALHRIPNLNDTKFMEVRSFQD